MIKQSHKSKFTGRIALDKPYHNRMLHKKAIYVCNVAVFHIFMFPSATRFLITWWSVGEDTDII